MSDAPAGERDPDEPGEAEIELSESEMGEPIAELSLVEEDPRLDFLARVRDRIENRRLGAHVAAFVWHAPLLVLMSLVEMMAGFVRHSARGPDATRSGRADRGE